MRDVGDGQPVVQACLARSSAVLEAIVDAVKPAGLDVHQIDREDANGRAATEAGTSTTTGDGGMTEEERGSPKTRVYQCLPSRYGFDPDHVRRAAIEIVIGQGAKPGDGGMLLGQKVNPRVVAMRTLPEGVDQRSACRHPDGTGPDDLAIKIRELREITDWEAPIFVKVGATRSFHDVKLAVHAGADVVVVDGMQGGTAATQTVFSHLADLRQAGCPPPRARGPGGADRGGRGDGRRAAGRHELDSRGAEPMGRPGAWAQCPEFSRGSNVQVSALPPARHHPD